MKEQVVLITGAAGALGQELTKEFARRRANVIATDLPSALERVHPRLLSLRNVNFLEMDVTRMGSIRRVVAEIYKQYGQIDVLINNAGIHTHAPIVECTETLWTRMIDTCLNGAFRCIKVTVPIMIRKKYGRIINIASIAALQGSPGYTHYCAAKAGLLGLTKALAVELAPFKITVNAVAPGPIVSPMLTDLLKHRDPHLEMVKIPVGRFGEPADIVYGVLFLASPQASWITGTTLVIDGGKHLGWIPVEYKTILRERR
ncbi:SDR family NAD(P)-dependent oxidoreductase [Candidatus Hadarchaeum sp.]|uniref:SDR family NAD(P)-dependent oxidoreductase n=1 Tax=Candidatus Hadarchaeum sp. TaxID=2883567 RepID=UPI00319DA15F